MPPYSPRAQFKDLSHAGAITAKGTYGVQKGWIAHGFTDNRMGCGMLGEKDIGRNMYTNMLTQNHE